MTHYLDYNQGKYTKDVDEERARAPTRWSSIDRTGTS